MEQISYYKYEFDLQDRSLYLNDSEQNYRTEFYRLDRAGNGLVIHHQTEITEEKTKHSILMGNIENYSLSGNEIEISEQAFNKALNEAKQILGL